MPSLEDDAPTVNKHHPASLPCAQPFESSDNGNLFYDFGFGNETGYYDVTRVRGGVPCNGLEGSERAPWGEAEEEEAMRDPAGVCYTGTYPTDAFVGRAMEVSFFSCFASLF